MNALHVELFAALIGVDAILLLFHVGELSVAEAADVVETENIGCQTLQTFIVFFFGFGIVAISP